MKIFITSSTAARGTARRQSNYLSSTTGKLPMPFCLRACDEKKPQSPAPQIEWREPPGKLGDYVRRIKTWSDFTPPPRK